MTAADGGQAVARRPFPLLARARWGDRILAESSSTVRAQAPGGAPLLCFPVADVRLDALWQSGRTETSPVTGGSRLWSIEGGAGNAGDDVLRTFDSPPPELAWLSGLAAFDQDRVRVEVIDAAPGSDERDVTVKRFPVWGDAADLIDVLDVRPDGSGRFVSATRPSHQRAVVEGSQMLGQAIVAASRHVPGRRVVSSHMLFVRAADVTAPLQLELDELTNGRTFAGLAVEVRQGDRRCAGGVLLLDAGAPDVVRHAVESPPVPGPYESEPLDMSVTGRDIRVVDGAYTDNPDAPVAPPVIDAWVRFRDVPDDPPIHVGLLAQFTGHMAIATALRPHAGIGQRAAHRSLSTAVNAIGLSLHADVRADRWMRYHHHSTFTGDGMTHAECRVLDEAGSLLASFTVDAMVRGFAGGAAAGDERRAL